MAVRTLAKKFADVGQQDTTASTVTWPATDAVLHTAASEEGDGIGDTTATEMPTTVKYVIGAICSAKALVTVAGHHIPCIARRRCRIKSYHQVRLGNFNRCRHSVM